MPRRRKNLVRRFRRNPGDLETLEKMTEALDLYAAGYSVRQISRQLHVHSEKIKKWLAHLLPDPNIPDPRIEQAIELYQQGVSLYKISKKLRVNYYTLKKWLEKSSPGPDPRIEQAKKLFRQGVSKRKIEKQLRVGYDKLEKWLEFETEARAKKETANRLFRMSRARELYESSGWSSYSIAMHLSAGKPLIDKWTRDLQRGSHTLRRHNPENLETLETIAKARKLYQDGHSITEIRKRLQVRWNAVRQWVDDLIEDKSSLQQRARELYAETRSIKEVAERLGVTRYHIDPTWIADIRDTHRKQRIAEARQVYQQTNSIEQAARAVGVSYYRAKEWLLDLIPKKPEIDPRRERARQLYLQGKSIAAVAKAVHAKWDRVKGWVEDLIQEDTRPQRARELYQELGNYKSVARQLGVGWRTVRNWVSQRNPDDLEALEQMVRARKLYQESGSINAVVKELFGKTSPSYFYRVRTWVQDMIPPSKKLKKDYSAQIEQARALYQQGVTSSIKLAKAAGVSQATAYKWIHKGLLGEPPVDPRIAKAIDVYKITHSLTQAARAVRASIPTVKKWVADVALPEDNRKDICIQAYLETGNIRDAAREAGVDHKKAKKWIMDEEAEYVDPRVEQARELYRQTKSIKAVARSMPGTARITIRKWVEDLMPKGTDPRITKARELRKEGMGLKAIGRAVKADSRTVRKWVSQRRNPDDLETLEQIVEARRLYQKLGSVEKVARRLGINKQRVRTWLGDLPRQYTKQFNAQEAVNFLKQKGGCAKATDLKEFWGVSTTQTNRRINKLIKAKIILPHGGPSQRIYCLPGVETKLPYHDDAITFLSTKDGCATNEDFVKHWNIDVQASVRRLNKLIKANVITRHSIKHTKFYCLPGVEPKLPYQDEAVAFFKSKGGRAKTSDFMKLWGLTSRPTQHRLNKLIERNIIEAKGPRATRYYCLVNTKNRHNPDTRLRELERIFNQSPTYYNLAKLEAEKQRKGLVDYSNRNMMADTDDEVTIEGEVWSCTVVYEPGHYSNNTVERVSIAHIIVDDDDLEIEVDVMPLLSKEEIKALEDKITERGWDEYCDWRDNQF